MIIDDAYFRWFDDDQRSRGMTDASVDEVFEWADHDADKAPAPVVQLFREVLTPRGPHGVERAPRGAVSGEAWGPVASGRHVGTGKPHGFDADGPPWKDAA